MGTTCEIDISPLVLQAEANTREEAGLVHLCELVNSVYNVSEAGMWQADRDLARTNLEELRQMADKREIFTARKGEEVVGCIQCKMLSEEGAEFGMLVVDPKHRKEGIGKKLIEFAERACKKQGAEWLQLCLLHPKTWEQPTKQILKKWYPSLGYIKQEELDFSSDYGALAKELAGECYFTVYRKTLLV